MTEVYCIGNGEVFLSYEAYIQYCISKGIKPQYEPPVIKNDMTEEQRKQYEEAAKVYVKRQGTHDRPDITHHDFMSGCEYAHEKVENRSLLDDAERKAYLYAIDNTKKEAHNKALEEIAHYFEEHFSIIRIEELLIELKRRRK